MHPPAGLDTFCVLVARAAILAEVGVDVADCAANEIARIAVWLPFGNFKAFRTSGSLSVITAHVGLICNHTNTRFPPYFEKRYILS